MDTNIIHSVLEWLLKDHMNLKPGETAVENSALPSEGKKLHLKKYIKMVKSSIKFSQYYCVYTIIYFWANKCTVVSIRDFYPKQKPHWLVNGSV